MVQLDSSGMLQGSRNVQGARFYLTSPKIPVFGNPNAYHKSLQYENQHVNTKVQRNELEIITVLPTRAASPEMSSVLTLGNNSGLFLCLSCQQPIDRFTELSADC
jgi:hypothetical protein